MNSMLVLFFLVGLASEITYARWTVTIVQNRLISLFWAFLWASINVFFIMQLASSQSYFNGLLWVLGVVVGTGIEIIYKQYHHDQQVKRLTKLLTMNASWELVKSGRISGKRKV